MDGILYKKIKGHYDFTIKVNKLIYSLSEMQNHYNFIHPLRNLYHGILLNDMKLIATNVKSINKIINPTEEVIIAYESIILINLEIGTIL